MFWTARCKEGLRFWIWIAWREKVLGSGFWLGSARRSRVLDSSCTAQGGLGFWVLVVRREEVLGSGFWLNSARRCWVSGYVVGKGYAGSGYMV